MTARKSFAKILKQQRLKKGLSQEALAYNSGLSMRSISLMECNKQQPTISTIEALANALDTTMTDLIAAIEHHKQAQGDMNLDLVLAGQTANTQMSGIREQS